MLKRLLYIAVCALYLSCNNGKKAGTDSDVPLVARAGSENLDEADFKDNFISPGGTDSAANAKKAIENWASEALFYQEAIARLESDELQVEKQVEAYRRELVSYLYTTRIIDANLDTVISNNEIESYYNDHRDNFILKENLIRVNYIKVPVKAQGLDKIKKILFSPVPMPGDGESLKKLCVQYADNFFINDSTWLYMDEIRKEMPLMKEQPDFSFAAGRMFYYNDEEYFYYLKIKDVKIKNSLSPINFESRNIKKFIINNRKAQLILQYKQLLLEKAKANKTFEVYKN